MDDYIQYVDPFLGNGEIKLPKPEGIAATWFFIKAQSGNTHPGASLPFGMVTACGYTGGYSSGYDLNCPNFHSVPRKFRDKIKLSGFTHMHQSGTGAAGKYYNYVRVTPFKENLFEINDFNEVVNENAFPGNYSAKFQYSGINSELTVTSKGAFHRYTFADSKKAKLAIDFSAEGIKFEQTKSKPAQKAKVEVLSDNEIEAFIVMQGIPIYIYAVCDGNIKSNNLWIDCEKIEADKLEFSEETYSQFGSVFEFDSDDLKPVNLRIGFSLISCDKAKANINNFRDKSFDSVVDENREIWNNYLSNIEIEGATEKQKEIFYSNFYHSLVKPTDFSSENPFWKGKDFYLDFVTFWDIYKTQMPLVMTLYPEKARAIVNSLIGFGKYLGELPISIFVSNDFKVERKQARTLVHFLIMDAFYRKIKGVDWNEALDIMVKDICSEGYSDFVETGFTERYTHILDMADACYYTAQLAKHLGENETYKKLVDLSKNWINAYDKETGLLSEKSLYYEGGNWNYSFRLQHNMKERISLYKKEEDFVKDLDSFFGYGKSPVKQPFNPDDSAYIDDWGLSLNCFEGFNNEPDMETPYAYIFAGRPDRTAEVVRAGIKYMYTDGKGGIPGNNDSGAMSSCYVWNTIGIFPVAGQPLFLIGSPVFTKIKLRLKDKEFIVITINNSDNNIYVQSAKLNGVEIDRAYLTVDEVMSGGKLELTMGNKKSAWATVFK
jgi:putative alpha-1,2-mannosidase